MVKGRVSVIIPSNKERFLQQTIDDVFKHAAGDVQVAAILDGYWPVPQLKEDERLLILRWGDVRGMRPGINGAIQMSDGEFILKLDAHCAISQGFDEVLKADIDDNTIVVPRRQSLDPHNWCRQDNGKAPVDYHFLSYPFEPGRAGVGLHGTVWNERARERKDILFDEEMSSQGSSYFITRKYWDRQFHPLNVQHYGNFVQEFQEVGLKAWLGGGRVMVNKKAEYWHWHKGKEGRGYFISKGHMARGSDFCLRYWMLNQWEGRQHDLQWLIERFAPVPSWPKDIESAFRMAKERLVPVNL